MGIHDNRYTGMACIGMVMVHHNNTKQELIPRFDLENYCGNERFKRGEAFDWGCSSPECFQLGISILANEYGDDFAIKNCEGFTKAYLCALDEDKNWELTSDELDKIIFKLAAS